MQLLSTIFLNIALLVGGAPSNAGVIRGEVVDSEGAAIANAKLRVLDDQSRKTIQTVQSDNKGHFELQGLRIGRYLMAVSAPGFSDELIGIDAIRSRENILQPVRMHAEDCDAPDSMCDSYGMVQVVHAGQQVTLGPSGAVSLDGTRSTTLTSGITGFHLSESEKGLYLTALGPTGFIASCRQPSFQRRGEEKTSSVRVDGLGPRSEICMATDDGRLFKVFVTRQVVPSDTEVELYVTTRWSYDPVEPAPVNIEVTEPPLPLISLESSVSFDLSVTHNKISGRKQAKK